MSNIAIRVQQLSKKYKIGVLKERHNTLRDHIVHNVKSLFRRNSGPRDTANPDDSIWALKNLSLEVENGEILGIIGRNGAGKSTLLKVLSRITQPTKGRCEIYGRVGSLLEVGTGFHGELTGRENIYLNGAILGMNKKEIHGKFDEIVAFAEVAQFLDTPVKRYSSGMSMRLAFAVAAHLEPEILIMDEVLAVGDAQFQRKCLGKLGDVANQGRTVLFVSHNMLAVSSLCKNAVWLEAGNIKDMGPARKIVPSYLAEGAETMASWIDISPVPRVGILGRQLRITGLEWLTDIPARNSETIKFRLYFESRSNFYDVSLTLGFSTTEGTRLLSYDSDSHGDRVKIDSGDVRYVEFTVEDFPLPPGIYSLDVGSRSGDIHTLDYVPNVARIEVVVGANTPGYIDMGTGVRLPAECKWGDKQAIDLKVASR